MHQKLPQNGTRYRKNGTKYRKISCEKAQNSSQNRTEICSIQTDSAAGKAQGKDSAFCVENTNRIKPCNSRRCVTNR